MSEDRYRELAPLAALGALDGEDRAAFEAHVRGCAGCQAELRAHESVAARLPTALGAVPPSPGVRKRVLEAAAREPRARRGVGLPTRLAAAAALVLAVAFLAALAQRDAARRDAERAAGELQAVRTQLDALRARLAEADVLRDLLARPDSRTATLAGLPPAPAARARVVWNVGQRQAVLFAAGLQPAPAGKAYELWVIGAAAPVPAGTFQVDTAGRAVLHLPAVDEIARVRTFAVTIEPAPGTAAPTGPMVLAGAVP